ncbi:MAG: hypothetical protein ACKOCB_05805 [Planctomycetia bacterium]
MKTPDRRDLSPEAIQRELEPCVSARALPDLVTPAVLASMTGMTVSATCRQVKAGLWGPYARIGRRYMLRRDSLLAALAEREVRVAPRARAPVARPPAWASHLPPPRPERGRA